MTDMSASAYVQAKRLCILGIFESPWGPIPFSHAEACDTEDGPVEVGDNLPPVVTAAIDQSQKIIMQNIQQQQIRLAAEELVDRTRAGDQNAAGLMIMIRENAKKGNPRAILSMKYMLKYGKSKDSAFRGEVSSPEPRISNAKVIRVLTRELAEDNPLKFRSAVIAMLPSLTMLEGGVTLSNGPDLDKDRIEAVLDKMNENDKKSFMIGFKDWRNTSIKTDDVNYRLGRIFGLARTLQLVRLPQTPISTLSKAAGLELD